MSPLLNGAIAITLALYALALVLGCYRLYRGPQAPDRVLALDFMYLVGMMVMLVLGLRYLSDMYFEGAMLLAMFGFVGSAATAKFILRGEVIE